MTETRPVFKKKVKGSIQNTQYVLSLKKGESESEAKARLEEMGWFNIDKVGYHTVDLGTVKQFHPGKAADCPMCLKRGRQKVNQNKGDKGGSGKSKNNSNASKQPTKKTKKSKS
jgi:hypothetical protein